jgi:hypothetical protein
VLEREHGGLLVLALLPVVVLRSVHGAAARAAEAGLVSISSAMAAAADGMGAARRVQGKRGLGLLLA